MLFVTNPTDGVRIHYKIEGEGPPMVLHHGGTGNIQRWINAGYVDRLRSSYRLILFDARGHGLSDKPHDAAAYVYERWVSDVVALLDHHDIERAHFFGYSHGAFVGFRMLQFAPAKVQSLVLGGGLPGQMYDHYNQQYELFKDGIDGLVRKRAEAGNPVTDDELQQISQMDPIVAAEAGRALRDEPSVADLLADALVPILAYGGANDTLINAKSNLPPLAQLLRSGEVLLLSGLDHGTAFRRSDRVLPYVEAFLQRVELEATS